MKPPVCPECRYDLRGLDEHSQRCPECGCAIEMEPVSVRARTYHKGYSPILVLVLMLLLAMAAGGTLGALFNGDPELLFATVPMLGVLAWLLRQLMRNLRDEEPENWPFVLHATEGGLSVACIDDDTRFQEHFEWQRMNMPWIAEDSNGRVVFRMHYWNVDGPGASRRVYELDVDERRKNELFDQMRTMIESHERKRKH